MSNGPLLKLGTRRSPLALAQAEEARARLCKAHGWDSNAVELVPVVASGDKVQDRPLAEIGGKALWTKELDRWLGEGRIHASVHSLKDVETIRPEALTLAAILPRADKRDRLIGAASLADLPEGAVIGTSAPRRAAQALHRRPDCKVVTFRGNVATRLAKLEAGEADATFLAAAGLERLGQDSVGIALDPQDWLPAPAQGAIAVECRTDDAATRELLSVLDHPPSRGEVMAERALLAALGGNCHSPIAVLCDYSHGLLAMRAAIFSPDGKERVEADGNFPVDELEGAAVLARKLLADAPDAVRAVFDGPA
ncbi:hydroxymethylbilane synthase [Aurantiacibacter gangjinensis]|uniref:Porphobilinogen deaminase n=1 Tax=Aurantiacibacter gangjinensis TaxID=502682 RepID=A0A0G9MMU3_9SPHN|nr:hydroxymethylbilane synthase [Aurantiacibacter gangjinensis]APE28150.1 Porphobilinogen deaminase [Aurantiacibacter gangjinensis]KLE32061.1 porphobilinogen deaminase [Aurantiacibacter gangjinensis]